MKLSRKLTAVNDMKISWLVATEIVIWKFDEEFYEQGNVKFQNRTKK